MKVDIKMLKKIFANYEKQYIKRIIHSDKVGFGLGMQADSIFRN